MNVGDRVRLMSGKEEGIITRILPNNIVEVAIDNDFTIPVARREIVVIAPEEAKFLQNQDPVAKPSARKEPPAPVLAEKGIYLAMVHQSDELLAATVINNTDYDVLFTSGEERNERYRGLHNDRLTPKATRVLAHYHLKDFERWPALIIQFLLHRNGAPALFEPVTKKVQFKAASFYKSKKTAPVLNKEGYVFQLDHKPVSVNTGKIQEQMLEKPAAQESPKVKAPEHEVDLHIEKLTDDFHGMSNSAMLKLQLERFQDTLERAMAANMHEVIFIHGAGNGVLRKEIQKVLSRTPGIKFYEDARKEKFGYGATLVRLR